MVFSSVAFLFYFLPATLLAVLLLPAAAGNFVLLAASLLFYAWGETEYVAVLLAVVLVAYAAGLCVEPARGARLRRAGLGLGVVFPLCALAYFKYSGFLLDNLEPLVPGAAGARSLVPAVLPLGISFFVFQAVSYVVDVHRGHAPAERRFSRLLLYKAFFPQLIAGPIVRYPEVSAQLAARRLRAQDLEAGAFRFVIGLAKKVLLANPIGLTVDGIFALPPSELSMELAWAGCLLFSLQLYLDFSGYSDMAIGLARMFGFRFPENFNHPYAASSVRDFWQRWHMTLSRWLRDYVYVPLGGNRAGPGRTYVNLVIVFLLCGLWHGASWTFVAWGAAHGAMLVLERRFPSFFASLPLALRHASTLLFVALAWVLFRSDTIGHAMEFYGAMADPSRARGSLYPLETLFQHELVAAAVVGALASLPVSRWLAARAAPLWNAGAAGVLAVGAARIAVASALLVLSAMSLSAQTHNPFLYFRF